MNFGRKIKKSFHEENVYKNQHNFVKKFVVVKNAYKFTDFLEKKT